MKTITEFFGKSLKAIEEKVPALQASLKDTVAEQMKSEGKSEEEVTAGLEEGVKAALQAKIGEENKVEGDKLAMLFSALEVARSARGNLKRIVVMSPVKEGEKGPAGSTEIDGKFYVIELFPDGSRPAPAADARDDRFGGKGKGRGGKPGGRDSKGGRDDKGGRAPARGEGRPPRAEAAAPAPGAFVIGVKAGATGNLPPNHVAVPKGDRPAKKPREARAPVEAYTGPNRIVPSAGAVSAAAAAAPAVTAAPESDGSSA